MQMYLKFCLEITTESYKKIRGKRRGQIGLRKLEMREGRNTSIRDSNNEEVGQSPLDMLSDN